MSIEILTAAEATPTAPDDGVLYRAAMNGQDRILEGCVLSIVSTSKIKITAGYLLICGRVCKVAEESLTVALASSGTQTKYLYVTVAPEGATVVAFGSGSSLPASDDINADESGTYYGLLAVYTATTSAVSTVTAMIISAAYSTRSFNMSNSAGLSVPHNSYAYPLFGTFEYSGNGRASDRYIESGTNILGLTIPAGVQSAKITFDVNFPGVTNKAGSRVIKIIRTPAAGGGVQYYSNFNVVATGNGIALTRGYSGVALPGDIFTFTVYQDSTETMTIAIGDIMVTATLQ